MAILTKFLQLLKPEKNDYVDVEKHLSENYDKIDAKMEELSNSNDEKLDKGNVPDVLNSAEKIIKALQGNTGIKFDENLLYLNDVGTKKKGLCYLDKLTDGIFECIQETTTTVNNATYFKNFSNKENSDRLSNLVNTLIDVIYNNNGSKITVIKHGRIAIFDFDNIKSINGIGDIELEGINSKYIPYTAFHGSLYSCDNEKSGAEVTISDTGIYIYPGRVEHKSGLSGQITVLLKNFEI